jgi:hypothetical protein
MSIITKTFRFKTDNLLQEELEYFAKVHQFDEKKSLKENFKKWTEQENISKLLEQESQRLESLNYQGNITKKLFTSLKYYHIKNLKTQTLPIPPPPPLPTELDTSKCLNEPIAKEKTKRQKQKSSVEQLQKIEKHILFVIKNNNSCDETKSQQLITISPNDAFKDYLVNEMPTEKDEEIIKRLKKIYKNKMFHLQKKLTKTNTTTTINITKVDDNDDDRTDISPPTATNDNA